MIPQRRIENGDIPKIGDLTPLPRLGKPLGGSERKKHAELFMLKNSSKSVASLMKGLNHHCENLVPFLVPRRFWEYLPQPQPKSGSTPPQPHEKMRLYLVLNPKIFPRRLRRRKIAPYTHIFAFYCISHHQIF